MLTIFSTPKAFRGHFELIQSNAIESWRHLTSDVEVILFGSDFGTAETCKRLGLNHVPDVALNEFGTPLLSDMFRQAQLLARHDVICYANADIILMSDFTDALAEVSSWRRRFLLVGRKCDLHVTERIDFDKPDWEMTVRARAEREGIQQSVEWIDYFAFSRAAMPEMAPFAVGRPGWDNWLLWNTRQRGIPIVNASGRVVAVHQNHDYSHHSQGTQGVRAGAEAKAHSALIGTWARMYTIDDSNYVLTSRGVRRNVGRRFFARRLEILRRRLIDWSRPLRRKTRMRALNRTWSRGTN